MELRRCQLDTCLLIVFSGCYIVENKKIIKIIKIFNYKNNYKSIFNF